MKKIKILLVILTLFLLGGYYTRYYTGFYLDFNPNQPVTVNMKTKDNAIYIKPESMENYEEIEIKGVELTSGIAGHYGTDYDIDKKTWLKWFKQIKEMGTNTIRISTIYDDTFYNAFYEFNSINEENLYLLQGIQVVDVIHGRKNIGVKSMKGSGSYRKDISQWVLGYVIGNGWNSGTMAYTNNNKTYDKQYKGEYFETSKNSTVFEAMLARIMDEMVDYESDKYKEQRLISFFNDPQNDPFVYDKHDARQLKKYNVLDAENIQSTDRLKSGYFASYSLYEFCPEFSKYFSKEQKEKLSKILPSLDNDLFYDGYTQLLSDYHSIPVAKSGTSSS